MVQKQGITYSHNFSFLMCNKKFPPSKPCLAWEEVSCPQGESGLDFFFLFLSSLSHTLNTIQRSIRQNCRNVATAEQIEFSSSTQLFVQSDFVLPRAPLIQMAPK